MVGAASAAIYGAAAAEPPAVVEAAAATLHHAFAELDVSERLRDSLIAQFARRNSYYDVVAHDPATGDPPDAVTTLVRLSVTSVQLAGAGINPG